MAMFFTEKKKIEDQIILVLSRLGTATAREIHFYIKRSGKNCTIQAIHQELRKLLKARIVIKILNLYALSLSWILELNDLTQQMYESVTKKSSVAFVLPKDGEKKEWKFSSLAQLVGFYTQLAIVILKSSKSRQLFESVPHVWYHLVSPVAENEFLSYVARKRVQYYLSITNELPLSRLYTKSLKKEINVSIGQNALANSYAHKYVVVVGDLISILHLGGKLTKAIDSLLASNSAKLPLNYKELDSILRCNSTIRLTVESNSSKAAKLRGNFCRYFGISDQYVKSQ